jgi:N-acylneuraminate cytidylyltransferase
MSFMNVAYIPVRHGSKSIPLKNIKSMCGKPLVWHVIDAACGCGQIDRIYVCTDSAEIADTVKSFGLDKVDVVGRSKESATDTASTEYGMLEFAAKYEFDKIVLIQATQPLLTAQDLTNGFETLASGADSVLSVVNQRRFIWITNPSGYAASLNYDYRNRPRRQDFDGFFVENGAFYITSKPALLESGCRLSGNIKIVEMPAESYFDVDEPSDWVIAENLLRLRNEAVLKGHN